MIKSKLIKDDIYLINLIKFRPKGKVKKIDLEEKMKNKNKFLLNQLSYLSNRSKYSRELERISKEKNTNFILQKKKSEISIKKEIKNLNYNQRILKSCSNKMILDMIINNQKLKNYFFSKKAKTKEKITKIKSYNEDNVDKKEFNIYHKYNLEKCHIDNIQLISNINKSDKNNKIRHSISSLWNNLNNIKFKNNFHFPIINTISLKDKKNSLHKIKTRKNIEILNNNDSNLNYNYIHRSHKILKKYYNSKIERDETKGMLTINYYGHKRNKINLKTYNKNFKYTISI